MPAGQDLNHTATVRGPQHKLHKKQHSGNLNWIPIDSYTKAVSVVQVNKVISFTTAY